MRSEKMIVLDNIKPYRFERVNPIVLKGLAIPGHIR